MIELTLSKFGEFLSEHFELDQKHIAFCDREHFYSLVRKNTGKLLLPAICYFPSDFSESDTLRKVSNRHGVTFDNNFTSSINLITQEVKINLSVVLFGLRDTYFKFLRDFWLLKIKDNSTFTVKFNSKEINFDLLVALTDLASISTPDGGKEGRDYDKGVYYSLEFSCSINSVVIDTETYPIIRKVKWSISSTPGIKDIEKSANSLGDNRVKFEAKSELDTFQLF